MAVFRVVDLRGAKKKDLTVNANTPETAATQAVGIPLVRSGSAPRLACKVYWLDGDSTNMVRLYEKISP